MDCIWKFASPLTLSLSYDADYGREQYDHGFMAVVGSGQYSKSVITMKPYCRTNHTFSSLLCSRLQENLGTSTGGSHVAGIGKFRAFVAASQAESDLETESEALRSSTSFPQTRHHVERGCVTVAIILRLFNLLL